MFESTLFSLLVLVLELTQHILTIPNPSFGYHVMDDSLSLSGQAFNSQKQLPVNLGSRLETPLKSTSVEMAHMDSWFAIDPEPPGIEVQDSPSPIGEPSAESVEDALRYAGFTLTEGQLKIKERPVSDQLVESKKRQDNKHLGPSHSQPPISKRVKHVHAVGPSKGKVKQKSTNEVGHTISISRSNLEQDRLPIQNFALGLLKDEWMTQLIDSFTLKFSETLHGLHPKPNQIQFEYTRKYLEGLPIVLTKMEGMDLKTTAFSWIAYPNQSYMERDQLIQSFRSLITWVVTDHFKILENLNVDTETIKSRNQMITGWVYDEILDPPIGYPIMGNLRGEVVHRVIHGKEPSFRMLNGFLAHYFGQIQPLPSPRALTSILINCWYFSKNSQIGARLVNHQAHLIALKEQIENNTSIPNASHFLSQFLS
ncbi:hypothetical protein KEM48_012326 [Puccinia striiformis f. sp. tritici PST-130]|nr:hypothetical protein KEM48_012326 [Puccinia striiformis f. sp. tritici PST-130]